MITISQQLVQQLCGVFRRLLPPSPSQADQSVQFVAGAAGLRVRLHNRAGAVEYQRAGNLPVESFAIPLTALFACEGTRADQPVTLESRTDGHVVLRWDDHAVPRSLVVESWPRFHESLPTPSSWAVNPPRLLTALQDTLETTATAEGRRFAVDCIQLRGHAGDIVATDLHQILCVSGFVFPWDDELLVKRSEVFASRELPTDQPLEVGRTEQQVVFRCGSWSIWLPLDLAGQFPCAANVISDPATATSRWKLSDIDADYLLEVIPRLPCHDPETQPLTIDLNGHVALLTKSESAETITHVLLRNSQHLGDDLRCHTDRRYLVRALRLGFREIFLHGAETPPVCRDAQRTYAWALLQAEHALAATDHMLSLTSPVSTLAATSPPQRLLTPRRRHSPQDRTPAQMTHNRVAETLAGSTPQPTNGTAPPAANSKTQDTTTGLAAVLREAEAVQVALRESHTRVSHLIAALKRHRRQSKLMQSTLASIKQLQQLEV